VAGAGAEIGDAAARRDLHVLDHLRRPLPGVARGVVERLGEGLRIREVLVHAVAVRWLAGARFGGARRSPSRARKRRARKREKNAEKTGEGGPNSGTVVAHGGAGKLLWEGASLPRSAAESPGPRHAQERPHGHGHTELVRPSDALRSRAG